MRASLALGEGGRRLLLVAAVILAVMLAAACAPPPEENDENDLNDVPIDENGEVVDVKALALQLPDDGVITFTGAWEEWSHAADLVGEELTSDEDPAFAATIVYQWDQEHIYFAVLVEDQVHSNPHSGQQIGEGDALEAGVWFADTTTTFMLALLDGGDLELLMGVGDLEEEETSYQVTRDEDAGTTLYEIGIPWAYFGGDFAIIPGYNIFSSVSIRQSSGATLDYDVDWTPGLTVEDPDPELWADIRLESEDTLPD